MKVFLSVGEENRIMGWGTSPLTENYIEKELTSDDAILQKPLLYKLVDGELIYDKEYLQTLIQQEEERSKIPTTEEEVDKLKSLSSALVGGEEEDKDEVLVAASLNHALQLFAKNLPEQQALEIAAIYPRWIPNQEYQINDVVRYGKNPDNEPQIYRVEQAHTSQPDWTPDKTAALFTKLGFEEDGTAVWVQPLGAHDAYQLNDIVSHNGKNWISTVDGNTWEPGVYGWKEQTA